VIPCPVNIASDPTLGINTHTYWQTVAPAPAPSTPTYAVEMITLQMWTAGYVLGKNQFTTTVKTRKMPVCLTGHDIGPLIPDVTIPPSNIYYTIMWPFSSRKMSFAASTVKFDKKPVGCACFAPPFPMMTCGDPLTLPGAYPILNLLNQVRVGMTPGDVALGVVSIAASIAVDAVFEWKSPFKDIKGPQNALLNEVLGKVGLTPKAAAKNAMNALAGFAIGETAAYFSDSIEPPTTKLNIGGGLLPEAGIQIGGNADDPGFASAGEVAGREVGVAAGNTPSDPLNIFTDP